MAKKVTIQQIADYLGVSKYVVSKALSGKRGVSADTRKKVIEAASQLGYFAQKTNKAPSIQLQETKLPVKKGEKEIVLVLMTNVRFQTRESTYWGAIVDGISEALEKIKLGMVLLTENNVESLIKVLNLEGFIGVITVGLVESSLLVEVHKMGLPLVMIDYEDPLIPCDMIFNNNFDSSFQLANHLIGLGHKHIQFVGDIHYSRSFYDRWSGLRSSIEENGIKAVFDPDLISIDFFDLEKQFSDWLGKCSKEDLPTAFVCANDVIAVGVISILKKNGIHVPNDVSVTGFDNKEITFNMKPTVSTVHVEKENLGKRAVEVLLRRMREQDAPFEKILMSGSLILRESTAPPRDKKNQ
ncbi:LacI family transcriptional regulator [Anoxybacillus tepidamans]|uniref:LacI family transcriptional regulator n=1 Tax=Anoxybacteroides tepidamans TaxID=265948 RepID=A0A7W8ITW9_9BACL|nr:LacI family DNA-binding transcriptional regulator [Anoxybacillus tepidamans]MBB5325732.1 LacI family transcriptional regulator [Anoxybacillus tepidamans]